MTITERIKRLEALRREGIDWSEMDRAMYGPLPQPITERMGPFARRLLLKQLPPKEFYNGAVVPDGDGGAA